MKNDLIRTLYPEEIELKVQMVRQNGACFILYKDSRVDMNLLDEAFGPLGWKNEHFVLDGKTFCTISIWDSVKNEWITKSNVGSLDNNNGAGGSAKVKGEISDSFKRAATVVGIGRELYTAPFIWIGADKIEIRQQGDGKDAKYSTNTPLHVSMIEYDEKRRISLLEIQKDRDGQVVYRYHRPGYTSKAAQNNAAAQNQRPAAQQQAQANRQPNQQNNAANTQAQQRNTAQPPVQQQNPPAPPQNSAAANTQARQNPAQPPANGSISVASVQQRHSVAPGDVVIPVGWAKGQTLSTYYQREAARRAERGEPVVSEEIFDFYLTLTKPEFTEFKKQCQAFIQTLSVA